MSRSKKKGKPPGYDYWSRRPTAGIGGTSPGRWSKTKTHRLERIEARKVIKKQTEDKDE